MRRELFLIAFSVGVLISVTRAQDTLPGGYLRAFSIPKSGILKERLAQPTEYFDRIGHRCAIMGLEGSGFETWVWPWKLLRNFELSFLLGTSTSPIRGQDIVRTVRTTPELVTFTYTYESFCVKEHLFVPMDERGAVILLEVSNTVPLTIVAGFLPVMQPEWPAGVGGQFSYWDDHVNGYVISEGRWRGIGIVASPLAVQMAAPPAHMFADSPLQFAIPLKPAEAEGKFIPIIIAGGNNTKFDSVLASYKNLWAHAGDLLLENFSYFKNLRARTIQIHTPDHTLNDAFEWGKVNLDNLLVRNDILGAGLVAGYGVSGGGARPGFAWFFGGDAFINSLAMDGYGDPAMTRDALAFTQKWQRQESFPVKKKNPADKNPDVGKMAHELSQSEGLIDWWNDYHYGYNHADTTPWYLVAMGDYFESTADTAFIVRSWNSIDGAYQWCLRKDSDGDGLMDLKGAGLGALEFGKWVGIYSDMYTSAVWTQAIRAMILLSQATHHSESEIQARRAEERAKAAMEKKFWIAARGFYAYGATEKGESVEVLTPWPATAMMFGVLDSTRSVSAVKKFSESDLSTDWGTRSLSPTSEYFEPTNYNYGAVWPFLSIFTTSALYRYDQPLAGYPMLMAVCNQAFAHGIGVVPEVFSGTLNEKLGEGYHHQGFSTSGYMIPLMRGLIGIKPNAPNHSMTFRPKFPPQWGKADVSNVRIGGAVFAVSMERTDSTVSYRLTNSGIEPILVEVYPQIPPGGVVLEGTRDAASLNATDLNMSGLKITLPVNSTSVFTLRWVPVPEIDAPAPQQRIGEMNESLKIIDQSIADGRIVLTLEGRSGMSYKLHVRNGWLVRSCDGASISSEKNNLEITFPANGSSRFQRKTVAISYR